MKAFNSGNRKSKLIVRFLKGVGSVSLTSPMLDKNGVAKKIGNKLSLKRHGFGYSSNSNSLLNGANLYQKRVNVSLIRMA